MRILSRYLLREHLGPFAFAAGALTGLMILNQVARQFSNLIGKGLPWGVIGEVFALSLPFILAMTMPMAVLVAVLHAFSRLGADSEITALKASGVHLKRFVAPAIGAAAVMTVAVFIFVDQALPRTNHKLKTLLIDIARKKPTFELKEQQVNEVVPGQLFLRAGRIDQASDRMYDVVIYDLARDDVRRTIYADSGYIRFNESRTDLYMTLFDGYAHDYNRAEAATFRRIFFRSDVLRVRGVSNTLHRTGQDNFRSDREMSVCEMEAIVSTDARAIAAMALERSAIIENDLLALAGVTPPRGDTAAPDAGRRNLTTLYCGAVGALSGFFRPRLAEASQVPDGARRQATPRRWQPPRSGLSPSGDLPARVAVQEGERPLRPRNAGDPSGTSLRAQLGMIESRRAAARQHSASYQVEIHKKYAIAISCLVFVLIGAPVALRFPRGGIGLVIGASVVIFGFYYIGLIGGETLADRLIISPFWAMWGPNLLMTGSGLLLFSRLGRETASQRGGGFAELWRRIPSFGRKTA